MVYRHFSPPASSLSRLKKGHTVQLYHTIITLGNYGLVKRLVGTCGYPGNKRQLRQASTNLITNFIVITCCIVCK